jgi:hypothetical protein
MLKEWKSPTPASVGCPPSARPAPDAGYDRDETRKRVEVDLLYLVEYRHHSLLNDFVLQRCDARRTLPPVSLRNKDSPRRFSPIRSTMHPAVQIDESIRKPGFIFLPRYAVDSGPSLTLKRVKAVSE